MNVMIFIKNTVSAGMTEQVFHDLVRLGSHSEKRTFDIF